MPARDETIWTIEAYYRKERILKFRYKRKGKGLPAGEAGRNFTTWRGNRRMPWYLGNRPSIEHAGFWPGLVIPLAVWSAIWTGLALWHAAQRREKWWFIFFLLVHTAGILEILYLIFVAKVFASSHSQKKRRK